MRLQKKFMRVAILEAKRGINNGENPFGACIVRNNKIISCSEDRVVRTNDITAHAELISVRLACQKLQSSDLSKCVIYSTCEPCPLCFSAIHFANISTVVFGTSVKNGQKRGYLTLSIASKNTKKFLKSRVKIIGEFLEKETFQLIELWEKINLK
jgi:tRNA(Arg) A34 adenosine deaminase TadA